MNITLLDHTKLSNVAIGARTCWNSFHKGGNYLCPTDTLMDSDRELLERLLFKNKHESIFEHCVFVFKIEDIPRYVLQELARHRIASYSVKSSRYTLKDLRSEERFWDWEHNCPTDSYALTRAKRYLDIEPNWSLQNKHEALKQLAILHQTILDKTNIDEVKALLPEGYLTSLIWTINIRSLRNFLSLRLSKGAHYRIRQMATLVYEALPKEFEFLFEDLEKGG